MVAIARKLLVVVWHVLTHQVADRQADRPMVTRKVPRWGAFPGLAAQQGLSSGAFARQLLERLRLTTAGVPAAPSAAEGGGTLPCTAAVGS